MTETSPTAPPQIAWTDATGDNSLPWRAENGSAPPRRIVVGDDQMPADRAYRLACEGTGILWKGDFHNARQLLQAMARRLDRKPAKVRETPDLTETFHLQRQAQAQRARTLGMLLLPVEAGHVINLRRAPDVAAACTEAYGPADTPYAVSLRELQGVIGAHEWRKKGVTIPALGASIHPHYGVFSPVRGEYLTLVARAPLPGSDVAFDIGTGTGVLAAVLAQRGVRRVIGTDMSDRALACAQDNIMRLGLRGRVSVERADLFPAGQANLIVCNPPWLPGKPSSTLEQAVYDQDSRMLRGFLSGLREHLLPNGEGWLILSDLAEHLGLRTRQALLDLIADAGLTVVGRDEIAPVHPRAADATDPLHVARRAERTALWRLKAG